MNYYNEFDPKAVAWIRELIKAGMIPDGEVDERSITDVKPSDLKGYVQHHFFCGIGGWPYALRLAGWPDGKECWTGSCPCQPFSVAGKGKGLEDERHLWPAFRWLIAQCRPSICFGEQVASKGGREWLAGVRSDMEAMGYVVGAADLCAASVGAPHIRQRLFWVAENPLCLGWGGRCDGDKARNDREIQAAGLGTYGLLADSKSVRSGEGRQDAAGSNERNKQEQRAVTECHVSCFGMGYSASERLPIRSGETMARKDTRCQSERSSNGFGVVNNIKPGLEGYAGGGNDRDEPGRIDSEPAGSVGAPSWNGPAVWWPCRDGKLRRIPGREIESEIQRVVDGVSPGLDGCGLVCDEKIFPLTTETEGRAHLLRGYGNAIIPAVARIFIESCMEVMNG